MKKSYLMLQFFKKITFILPVLIINILCYGDLTELFKNKECHKIEDQNLRATCFKETGLDYIQNFYNPGNNDYFGKNLNLIFTDENLSLLQQKIKQATENSKEDTELLITQILTDEIKIKVFDKLLEKLAAIKVGYQKNIQIQDLQIILENTELMPSVLKGIGSMGCAMGISSTAIFAWAAIGKSVGLIATYITIPLGLTSVPAIKIIAGLGAFTGPVIGGIIIGGTAIGYGVFYWNKKYQEEKKHIENMKKIKMQIEKQMPEIVDNWKKQFPSDLTSSCPGFKFIKI
jgi:hypothetical protein